MSGDGRRSTHTKASASLSATEIFFSSTRIFRSRGAYGKGRAGRETHKRERETERERERQRRETEREREREREGEREREREMQRGRETEMKTVTHIQRPHKQAVQRRKGRKSNLVVAFLP